MAKPLRRLGLAAFLIALPALAVRGRGGDRAPATRGGEASCAELTPSAQRGRHIFQRGLTADGRPIEGTIASGSATLSGRAAACADCHAPEGEGTTEGGVAAPAITHERLASSARERGAYTDVTLAAAIREGRTPASRQLHPVMPRYRLTDADVADLLAYLGCVGRDLDPGVTEDTVKLGAALPLTGPAALVGTAMRDVLSAVFAEVNAQGGVFRRRLELVVQDSGGPAGEPAAMARLLDRGVLALVGRAWNGDPRLDARLQEERAPLVESGGVAGARGGAPESVEAPRGARVAAIDGVVFHVLPGPEVLARVAIKHLAGVRSDESSTALIVHTRDEAGEAWASGAREEAARRGLPAPASLPFEPGLLETRAVVEAARRQGARAILFWGPARDLAGCAARDPALGDAPVYASLGSIEEDAEALRSQRFDRVLFVYDGPLGARARAASEALRTFLQRAGVAPGPLGAQASAYVTASIVIEALKRAGAHVTREKLIRALEGLRDFDAGPVSPVSFARNRRVGVMGANIVRFDPTSGAAVRASEWLDVVP